MLLLLTITACVAPPNRELLSVPVQFVAAERSYATSAGGTLSLTRAELSLADLHLHSLTDDPTTPSTYTTVSGELLGQWAIDLIGSGQPLGSIDVYEGDLETASLQLLGAPTYSLEGTHTTASGDTVTFQFTGPLNEEVYGIPLHDTLDADLTPSLLTVHFNLLHALSYVDWSRAQADRPLTLADQPTRNAVNFGVLSVPSWELRFED